MDKEVEVRRWLAGVLLIVVLMMVGCADDAEESYSFPTRTVAELYQGYGSFLTPAISEYDHCCGGCWSDDVFTRHFYLEGYMHVLSEDDGFFGKLHGDGALGFWSLSGTLQDVNRYYYAICDMDNPDICIPAWTKKDQTQPGPYFFREDKPIRVWGLATESGFRVCTSHGW